MTPLSAITTLKALDALAMKSDVIAQNIANASTPNYRPMTVRFEDALRQAAKKGVSAVQAVKPEIVAAGGDEAGQPLRIDLELSDAAGNSGRYASLVSILNRQLQIQELVLSEGH